ncbi:uncharacterized protein LOC112048042 [Bicyclus anynana]|uniref:Uncharacterized protein LOC112048042 n=1 Tax=Bicyclus anynana TaxID=110368 RepID=A0A6J1N002_BICAN|nr:uncharacterized protein LOC112048042 [Bicyclus anynana]
MIHFKDTKNKSALSTRWAQMSKQEQIIEKKKMEIQAKLEAQKQAAALAAQAKLSNPTVKEETGSPNIFSNDGSFMSQYKSLIDKQNREKQEKEAKEKLEIEESKRIKNESKPKTVAVGKKEVQDAIETFNQVTERKPERGLRDRHRRWNDRGRNRAHSPMTPVIEDRKKMLDNTNIPSLMQLTVRPPDDDSPPPGGHHQWNSHDGNSSNEEYDYDRQQDDSYNDGQESDSGPMGSDPMMRMGPGQGGPGPIGGPGTIGHGPMGPGPMGPGPMGHGPMGPGPMPPGPMPPGPMPPGPMGPGLMGSRPMGPVPMGFGPMGPGPMGPGPMGPGPVPPGPNIRPGSNPGPNMGPGPMMGPGPNMPPVPPFIGGPPNFPMPPNFMGPNGPGGPCGPGPMPPNMCGPDIRGPGPNGPMPPFFPPFNNSQMPGPPNPMCMPNSMNPPIGPNGSNFGPQPPFGPGGPNFGPNGPPNMCPPNMPFMPPGQMPPGQMPPNSLPSNKGPEIKPLDNIPTPEPMKLQNIPPPMPMTLNHIPKPKDMEPGKIPAPPRPVLSADACPPPVHRAAAEVAANGDHWENVLKAIQDQNLWFLHNTNSPEYRTYRSLVAKIRNDGSFNRKPEVKPEDKYEPEFSLEDDDSNDYRDSKEQCNDSTQEIYYNPYQHKPVKREQASSQSEDEFDSRRDRRKRKKSRWGDDPPPADIKPPGVVAPLPYGMPDAKLSRIDEGGLKLTNINRNNQALMQYAMTNYGTTNLDPDDWKKCEDNFKLNLLYQDMLKKRQEVERLAYSGKHKYEYDSDEDTADGTWEHKLRAKEMNATEIWATELTKQAAGKHHIGDFLPPEELKKFMEKYSACKSGKEPDLSDYKEYKLKEDNVGFKMLQKLGWNEGQGLGAEGTGIVDPINKANQPVANMGLGASSSDHVSADDDEFDAYRKRMMLAYRFRPNPLNNPRRPYY